MEDSLRKQFEEIVLHDTYCNEMEVFMCRSKEENKQWHKEHPCNCSHPQTIKDILHAVDHQHQELREKIEYIRMLHYECEDGDCHDAINAVLKLLP